MQTLLEMVTETTSRLGAADSSTTYPLARIKLVIQNTYLLAGGLFPWTETAKAKQSSTAQGQDYYDYPESFYTDSIDKLYIAGKKYTRKAYSDFIDWRYENPSSLERYFADYGRQYWVSPTPTADGNLDIDVWGHEQVEPLVDNDDKTIFSFHDDSGNEAIVKIAFSTLIKRVDQTLSEKEERSGYDLLGAIFAKEKEHQQLDQRLNRPFFNVPNFFATKGSGKTGNFTVAVAESD
jgi:hypothetical protein